MGIEIQKASKSSKLQKENLERRYRNKLFLKNKKSDSQFRMELESICKRSSYLSYQWAKQLLHLLKQSDNQKLYGQYKSILKENCIRQGKKEKTFCPFQVRRIFIQQLTKRYAFLDNNLTHQLLNQAFQQCKAYFMVMAWLHQLVTLRTQGDQENTNTLQDKSVEDQQKIYQIMINLTLKTYNAYTQGQNIKKQICKQNLNQQLIKYLKKLNRNSKFYQNQIIIQKIQKLIKFDIQHIKQNIDLCEYFLGKGVIYSFLLTVKQIGRIDISSLWRYMVEQDHNKIFRNNTQLKNK